MKSLIATTLFLLSFSTMAGGRVTHLSASASGGTSHGDKQAAYERAEVRSYEHIQADCFAIQGKLLSVKFTNMGCKRKGNSRNKLDCTVVARGMCQIDPPNWDDTVVGTGKATTTTGNKEQACQKAQERALQAAEDRCWDYGGEISDYRFDACIPKKRGRSKDDYDVTVNAYAHCTYF